MPVQASLATRVLLFTVGSLCYALLGILSQLSKSPDGSYAYSLPSVVLIAEFVKLCLSVVFLTVEKGSLAAAGNALFDASIYRWLAFAVPSALYAINNNLDMLNNQHMDPATEQVLVQCKILTTGIVWWLVFKKALGPRKWFSLVLLFVGAVLAGWPSSPVDGVAKRMYIDSTGVVFVLIYVWISASAGVYNEWLYQNVDQDSSIHVSNIRLYTIGCLFNLTAHFGNDPSISGLTGLLNGFNAYCWALVLTYALMGQLLAQIMKVYDNIVKLFISGSSMYASAILSYVLFGYVPSLTFVTALVVVTFAMLLYNLERILPAKDGKTD